MFTTLPDNISETLLMKLFDALPELEKEIMPNGFSNSGLIHVFHPATEQQYKEHCELEVRLNTLFKKKKEKSEPLETFEEFIKGIHDSPVEEVYEMVSIYGDCLWDIFSNNHTVYNEKLESYHLGSFRGSAGFIADVIDKMNLVPEKTFDYMDFYMGSIWAEQRVDLVPVYEFIFKKLKDKILDWEYSFPRLGLISFNNDKNETTDMKDYDPATSLKKEFENENKKSEIKKLQNDLDNAYNEEFENAKYEKPSQVVRAYYSVYGYWPKGHPLAE